MTLDEMMFFDSHPAAMPLYEKLKDSILAEVPDARIEVKKTQISFFLKHMFAAISFTPVRRAKDRDLRPAPSGCVSPYRCGGGAVSRPLDASCHDRLSRRGGRGADGMDPGSSRVRLRKELKRKERSPCRGNRFSG